MDEVFIDDPNADEKDIQNIEWNNLKEKRIKDGVRDGYTAGQENSLQAGFNHGFRVSAHYVSRVSKIRGVLSIYLQKYSSDSTKTDLSTKIESLIDQAKQAETRIETILKDQLNPYKHPQEDNVENSIELLNQRIQELSSHSDGHETEITFRKSSEFNEQSEHLQAFINQIEEETQALIDSIT